MTDDKRLEAFTEEVITHWLSVACPACRAEPTEPCVLVHAQPQGSPMHLLHLARRDLAEGRVVLVEEK